MKTFADKSGEEETGKYAGKNAVQLKDNRFKSVLQKKQVDALAAKNNSSIQKKENNTGLPDNLKSGIENLSGHSLDDVKVHYNSAAPAQLNAHAYAQGNQIHVAPGQEKHLPHEAWHVVQQKQGRVKPTKQLKGKTKINDDAGLEKEADVMGAKALSGIFSGGIQLKSAGTNGQVAQLNSIVKHEWSNLENPVYTVAKHLSYVTGLGIGQVLGDMNFDVPTTPDLDRPDRVIAYLNNYTGSGARTPMITEIGHMGQFEETLRGRSLENYDGGHLLALELWNTWPLINTPSNLAPQRRNDNRAPGEWRRAELQIRNNVPVIYESAVNYPDRTYTVTANGMGSVLIPGSPTALALANAGLYKWLPRNVYSWVPSQFHVSVTAASSDGTTTDRQTPSGNDPTNWMPILHRIASPAKGFITRIIPYLNVVEHQSAANFLGGIDVRSQGQHPVGDSLNELKQILVDLTKLTSLLNFSGYASTVLSYLSSSLPGMSNIIALSPSVLSGAPLAALIVYALAHQFNISRILPNGYGLSWVKYFLELIGL